MTCMCNVGVGNVIWHKIRERPLNYCWIYNFIMEYVETVLIFIKSYLYYKRKYVEMNFRSQIETLTCGVLQGFMLEPLRFVIYLNNSEHDTQAVTISLYVDGTSLVTRTQTKNK